MLYHVTQRKVDIKRETTASVGIFSVASFVSMCSLLLQLHLARADGPVVPLAVLARRAGNWVAELRPP